MSPYMDDDAYTYETARQGGRPPGLGHDPPGSSSGWMLMTNHQMVRHWP
jgi:hypothetical protein